MQRLHKGLSRHHMVRLQDSATFTSVMCGPWFGLLGAELTRCFQGQDFLGKCANTANATRANMPEHHEITVKQKTASHVCMEQNTHFTHRSLKMSHYRTIGFCNIIVKSSLTFLNSPSVRAFLQRWMSSKWLLDTNIMPMGLIQTKAFGSWGQTRVCFFLKHWTDS